MIQVKIEGNSRRKGIYKLITNGYGRALKGNIFEIPRELLKVLDKNSVQYTVVKENLDDENPIRDPIAAGV